jgi:hypothetical protein
MLSITECVRKIKNARKEQIKAKTLETFYREVLDNAQMNRLNGTIDVQFSDQEFDIACEAIRELLDYDFDFQRYVELDDRFLEDREIVLEFNLDTSLKVVDNESKTCDNKEVANGGYAEEDIPF